MTSASHAEGRQFDSASPYIYIVCFAYCIYTVYIWKQLQYSIYIISKVWLWIQPNTVLYIYSIHIMHSCLIADYEDWTRDPLLTRQMLCHWAKSAKRVSDWIHNIISVSLVGQDIRFSPWRPGFKSRTEKFSIFVLDIEKSEKFMYINTVKYI